MSTTIPVGSKVTACNPGGREITGTYIGAGRYPNTVSIEWTGPWMFEGARTYVGSFPITSMREAA